MKTSINSLAAFLSAAVLLGAAPVIGPVPSALAQEASPIKAGFVAVSYEGGKAEGRATTFKPTQRKLVCALVMKKMQTAKYHVTWIAVDAAGLKNYVIQELDLPKMPANSAQSSLKMPRDWPTGTYRVDWIRDGKPCFSVPFTIK